jgi:hypothetical protein
VLWFGGPQRMAHTEFVAEGMVFLILSLAFVFFYALSLYREQQSRWRSYTLAAPHSAVVLPASPPASPPPPPAPIDSATSNPPTSPKQVQVLPVKNVVIAVSPKGVAAERAKTKAAFTPVPPPTVRDFQYYCRRLGLASAIVCVVW